MVWLDRLRTGPPLLLDGATGTELERHGVVTTLPLWSAHALIDQPDALARVHADYAAAGAEALTANTFRTQRRTLERAGIGDRAAELTALAVSLARSAAPAAGGVFGSAPPLEDCFSPARVADDDTLAREHAEHARNLADAGVDGVLAETMNTIREARAAVRAARAVGLPVVVSFVCWNGAELLSGEPLGRAVDAVRDEGVEAVAVNCLPPSNTAACLPALAGSGLPFGVYANLGEPEDRTGWRRTDELAPAAYAAHARTWCEAGATLVGGCCGTTPAYTAALAQLLRS